MALLVMIPRDASAQDSNFCGILYQRLSPECKKEFDDWLEQEMSWRQVYIPNSPNEKIRRTVRTTFGHRKAVVRPLIPTWLGPYCLPEMSLSIKSRICKEYDTAIRYDFVEHLDPTWSSVTFVTKVPVQIGEQNAFIEYLLKNVHIDLPGTNSSIGTRVWSIMGTHLTIAHRGRFYFWPAPGNLYLRMPDGSIERRYTYGIDIFLKAVPLVPFKPNMKFPIYISVARAFADKDSPSGKLGMSSNLDMVWVSFTLK